MEQKYLCKSLKTKFCVKLFFFHLKPYGAFKITKSTLALSVSGRQRLLPLHRYETKRETRNILYTPNYELYLGLCSDHAALYVGLT